MRRLVGFLAILATLVEVGGAAAQSPTTITYQGRLTDPTGAPITAGSSVVFSIYAASAGGSAVWTETLSVTPDAEGIFAAVLGATTPLNTTTFNGAERFLGIKVGSDAEMTPRQRINAVPYAMSAGAAPTGGGGTVTSVATGAGLTGGPVTTSGTISVATGGIANSMLVDNAVTSAKVQDATLTAADLAVDVVSTVDGVAADGGDVDLIAGSGITITPDDAQNRITISSTASGGSVTSVATGAGLTGGPVTTSGTISVATGGISSAMIADGVVGSADIADGSVGAADIADGGVGAADIADGAVGTADILDGTIANVDIGAAAAIAATKIAGDAGVEFAGLGSSSNIPTTARNLGSIVMSIPAAGYVLVVATCTATVFGDNTEIVFGLGTTSGGFELHQAQSGFLDGSATTRREYSMTSLAVASVAAGSSTFYCNTVKTSVFSANTVNLGEIQLMGVFIPKRY